MAAPIVTHTRLIEALHYDPDTGVFVWRIKPSSKVWVGDVAGDIKPTGYVMIGVDGRRYLAHRLAWFYVHREWPVEVDHVNRDRADNRLVNLRASDSTQNKHNVGLRPNNTSGHKGVSWDTRVGCWYAKIRVGGRRYTLGRFDTAADAGRSYDMAALLFHPHSTSD